MKVWVFLILTCFTVAAHAQQCVEPDTTPTCKEAPPPSCDDVRQKCGESLTMSLPTEVMIESCTGSMDCLIKDWVSTHLMCGGAACVDSIYDPDEDTSDSDY